MNLSLYVTGTLFLICVILVFRFSYLSFQANHALKSLSYILLGGTMLRVWCLLDKSLHAWDERYHALVAKNLTSNPLLPLLYKHPILPYDYHNWGGNHIWLHKQPISLWFMSFSIYVFGNVEWAVRVPSLLLSVACIYLTYSISKFFTNEKTALLGAFLQAVNGLVIEIAAGRQATDHVDNTFLFFVELSIGFIVLYIQKKREMYFLGIGIAMGLAILTKSFPALIVIPIFFTLTIKQNGSAKALVHCFLILVTALVIYLPWQIYIYNNFPQEAIWENHYNFLHLTEAVEGHTGNAFWQLSYALKIWNELIYIVFLWFMFFASKRLNNEKIVSLIIWIVVPYLFFSLVATKMIAYPLFTAPAVFIIEALFCWQLIENPFKPAWLSKLLIIAIIVLAARYGYERVKPFENQLKDNKIATTIKNWAVVFSKNEKNVLFNSENHIECMFYHDNCIAYPYIPTTQNIDSLQQLGYTVFMIKNSKIDTSHFNKTNIKYLEIDSWDE
jgi:4-amino-4-deoxy-L-arabinose transferase-like glycosyltransferase